GTMTIFEFKVTAGEGFSNPYYFINRKRVPEWTYQYKHRLCIRFDCFHTEQLTNGRYRHISFGYQE
ncbi:MAG: hypothetical protein PUB01_00520, partial [Desulfovibrionaceae bacterium]|nr:hypothetical protein [Desulfovibrionaceae bacterium]